MRVELAQALIERDDFKVTVESQKDIIADLSRQINEATIKKEAKTKATAKKTTTKKTTTKKKEVKK